MGNMNYAARVDKLVRYIPRINYILHAPGDRRLALALLRTLRAELLDCVPVKQRPSLDYDEGFDEGTLFVR